MSRTFPKIVTADEFMDQGGAAETIDLKEAKLSQRDALLEVADDAEIWRTPECETFATFIVGRHCEHHHVNSRAFRDWLLAELARRYTSNERPAAAGANALRDALLGIEARALSNGQRQTAWLRSAEHKGDIYLDCGTEDWTAIRVTRKGWDIVPQSPVPLTRTRKTAPLPVPAKHGDLGPLRQVLRRLKDDDFSLLTAWMLGALYPTGPYPILIFGGEAGTGKSTIARLTRRLTDPTRGDLLQPPGDDRDLIAAARHNRVLAFDNISALKPDLADALCRIATGSELGGRMLYSDHEQATFCASRPVVLNGIPDLASRGDLASRSIIVRLDPLEELLTERDLWREVDAVLGQAFGALLDALAVALARLDDTPTPRARMADWARLVVAAEPALPWKPGTFLTALRQNVAHASAALVAGDLVAATVSAFADDHPDGWRGTMAQLFEILGTTISQDTRRGGDWPGSARWFGDRLRRAAPALRAAGVDIRDKPTNKGTIVHIEKLASLASLDGRKPPAASLPANGAGDPSEASEAISQVCEVRGHRRHEEEPDLPAFLDRRPKDEDQWEHNI
jgi:hypothetical protein